MAQPRVEIFVGEDAQYYWHLQSANGQIVAAGAEGFTRRQDAEHAASRALSTASEVVRLSEDAGA